MSACDEEFWMNQDALGQADRMAYICSVASKGKKIVDWFQKQFLQNLLQKVEN